MAFWGDTMPWWQNGPSPGAFYNFPGNGNSSSFGPATTPVQEFRGHSANPITTTTSVIGLKFNRGCILAADTLASYGSMARYRNSPRLKIINDNIMIGCSGDYADYQYMLDILNQKVIDEKCIGDGLQMKPRSLYCWLTRVLYNKRSKMDPLWNSYIVAGIQDGEPFLGTVDKLGTAYEDAAIATGLGALLATPLLRGATEKGLVDEETAKKLVHKCMEILYYRDARAFQRYQVGVITAAGANISDPIEVKPNWSVAHSIEMM